MSSRMMLGVAFGRPPAGLAVPGDRPALEARRVQPPEDRGRRPRRAARSRSPPPTPRGRAGASGGGCGTGRSARGGARRRRRRSPCRVMSRTSPVLDQRGRVQRTGRYSATAADEGDAAVTKRWTQRPPGSTWGDWGDDDELGRINLLTPEKVLAGRARGRGRHQLLPEPAARLSRRHRAEPAALPAASSRRPRTWTATPTPSTTST